MLHIKRFAFLTLLFCSFGFAEDLIIDGETVYLAGEQYYDNVVIVNNGVLSLVEFGGSNQTQGKLLLFCDSLYIDESSSINGNGAGGAYGSGIGGQGGNGTDAGRYGGGGGGSHAGIGGIGEETIPVMEALSMEMQTSLIADPVVGMDILHQPQVLEKVVEQ